MNEILKHAFDKPIDQGNTVDFAIVDKDTGEILVTGYTDKQAFAVMPVRIPNAQKFELKPQDCDKVAGCNIDHKGDGKYMWRANIKTGRLELKNDCEICPETGIPRKKKK